MTAAGFGRLALAACGVATGRLGWRPADFWDATPVEWVTALRGALGLEAGVEAPLSGADLQRMMREMPDG